IKKIERARVKMEQIKPRSTLPRGKKEGGLTVKLFKGHYTKLRRCRRRYETASVRCNYYRRARPIMPISFEF
ncbi:MAG: hypothetical protein ACREYE_00235, partial [Gammaproteobacteria bacterium]